MPTGLGWLQRECLRVIELYDCSGHRPETTCHPFGSSATSGQTEDMVTLRINYASVATIHPSPRALIDYSVFDPGIIF
jgi:hypothetical protein